jgi:hypothetical protein
VEGGRKKERKKKRTSESEMEGRGSWFERTTAGAFVFEL